MADPYAQLVIGGRNDQMTQKLKKRHSKQKKDYAAWVKQMRAQGYIVDATQTAYKETKGGELDEVMSYDQFKAGKKLKDKTALQDTRKLLDSQKITADTTQKLADGKANVTDLTKANAIYDIESDDPKGAVPFNVEGSYDPITNTLIPSGTNFSQAPSKGDTEFQTDGESLTEGKAEEAVTEKSYEDIIKMKRGKKRDELTIKHWSDKGYDLSGFKGQDARRLANDLRIGRANEMSGSAGTFLHINPAFRGAGTTIKKTVKGG